jgi:hypothetical protein
LDKTIKISVLEINLKIQNTFSKPPIRSVFKGEHLAVGFTLIEFLVKRFLNSFGFSTKHTSEQIEMIAIDTLENFGYESLEDIILFFKMARTGKFGETQKGVDSNLIFGKWFPMYLDKKSQLREKKHNDLKQESKNQNAISIADVEFTYRKTMIKKIESDAESFIINYTKNMDRQMLEDTINHWSRDKQLTKHVEILKSQRRVIK